jgi:hypothetical protein
LAFDLLIIDVFCSQLFEPQEVAPRSLDGGVREYFLFLLVVIKAVDYVEEPCFAHVKEFGVGCLA